MKKAVFLDRDGVLNKLVLNPSTREYEPPHSPEDLIIFPDVIESLKILQNSGFGLFLVTNQPDYAKGKSSLEGLHAVHARFHDTLTSEGIHFLEYFFTIITTRMGLFLDILLPATAENLIHISI